MTMVHIPLILITAGGLFTALSTPDHRTGAATNGNVVLAGAASEWWCKTFCPGPACPSTCPPENVDNSGRGDGPGHGERKASGTSDGPDKYEAPTINKRKENSKDEK